MSLDEDEEDEEEDVEVVDDEDDDDLSKDIFAEIERLSQRGRGDCFRKRKKTRVGHPISRGG
jgi:hypothetical protein